MSQHTFGARAALHALTGLDFGLRVRVVTDARQRPLFAGAENLLVRDLAAELAELVSSLRVYSYAMRGHLEDVTSALQANVECGSWRFARRAALDLAGLLTQARKRRLADAELSARGANAARRVAELCAREGR